MGAVAGVAGTKSTKILSGSELDKVIANKFVNEISYELVRNCWRVSVAKCCSSLSFREPAYRCLV